MSSQLRAPAETSSARRASRRQALGPPVVTTVAAIGFGVGLFVMLFAYGATTKSVKSADSVKFIGQPETTAWITILSFSVAFWAVASLLLWADVWTLRRLPRRTERIMFAIGAIAFFAILVAPLVVASKIRTFEIPLAYATTRIRILQATAGMLVVLPGVLSMWLHTLRFARHDYTIDATDESTDGKPGEQAVRSFRHDRAALLRAGSILGATVGLATLATGALRNAMLANGNEAISATMVLAYGAGYTAMLAIVYVPAYMTMQLAGQRIRDAFAPMELPGSPTYDEYVKRRIAWEELLQFKANAADSLRIGTAVLAPIVTGVSTVLVGITVH